MLVPTIEHERIDRLSSTPEATAPTVSPEPSQVALIFREGGGPDYLHQTSEEI